MCPPIGYAHGHNSPRPRRRARHQRTPPSPSTRALIYKKNSAVERAIAAPRAPARRRRRGRLIRAPRGQHQKTPYSSKYERYEVYSEGWQQWQEREDRRAQHQRAAECRRGTRVGAQQVRCTPTHAPDRVALQYQQHTSHLNTRSAQRLRHLLLFDLPPPAYSGGKSSALSASPPCTSGRSRPLAFDFTHTPSRARPRIRGTRPRRVCLRLMPTRAAPRRSLAGSPAAACSRTKCRCGRVGVGVGLGTSARASTAGLPGVVAVRAAWFAATAAEGAAP